MLDQYLAARQKEYENLLTVERTEIANCQGQVIELRVERDQLSIKLANAQETVRRLSKEREDLDEQISNLESSLSLREGHLRQRELVVVL